mgnify:CR=1 FL=1
MLQVQCKRIDYIWVSLRLGVFLIDLIAFKKRANHVLDGISKDSEVCFHAEVSPGSHITRHAFSRRLLLLLLWHMLSWMI